MHTATSLYVDRGYLVIDREHHLKYVKLLLSA